MISHVSIKNFKCLRDVNVELSQFTVFVGANGSGKTSILEALDLLCRTFRVQVENLAEEYRLHRSYGATEEIELSCQFGESHFRYRANSSQLPGVTFSIPQNRSWAGEGAAFASDGSSLDWKPWDRPFGMLPEPVWLRLVPSALRVSGPTHSPDPCRMQPDGLGLHTATAAMNLEEPDRWSKLQDDLRRIVPSIVRLRHTPQSELLFDTINGKGLKANQVSEGTLLTLALLTTIHSMSQPAILLLDDLDRALHPKAQRELIDLLRGVQTTNPEIQIVASTHSPYMLDRMKPSEVLITSLRLDGSTACEPITHHPKFETWKDEFYPGEMWSFFGEQWVTGTGVATR